MHGAISHPMSLGIAIGSLVLRAVINIEMSVLYLGGI